MRRVEKAQQLPLSSTASATSLLSKPTISAVSAASLERLRKHLEHRQKRLQEAGTPKARFTIAESEQDHLDITRWVQSNLNDPAFKVSKKLLAAMLLILILII